MADLTRELLELRSKVNKFRKIKSFKFAELVRQAPKKKASTKWDELVAKYRKQVR